MLTDTRELQRAYYTDWKKYSSVELPGHCKFCQVEQPNPTQEHHMPDCERLEYLAEFYDVETRKPKSKKWRHVIVDGAEFHRSGVYGWWTEIKEFKKLLKKAFKLEGIE